MQKKRVRFKVAIKVPILREGRPGKGIPRRDPIPKKVVTLWWWSYTGGSNGVCPFSLLQTQQQQKFTSVRTFIERREGRYKITGLSQCTDIGLYFVGFYIRWSHSYDLMFAPLRSQNMLRTMCHLQIIYRLFHM